MNEAVPNYPAPPAAPAADSLPLRDIHLPDPVSWWPPAPGWWLLLATLACMLLVYILIKKIRYARRVKRAGLQAFAEIKQQYQEDKDKVKLAQALSTLLRRVCISFYPRHNTAGLTGQDWLDYLDRTLPDTSKTSFNSETGKILLTAPYLPKQSEKQVTSTHQAIDYNAEALLDLCEQWLRAQPVKQTKNIQPSGTGSANPAPTQTTAEANK